MVHTNPEDPQDEVQPESNYYWWTLPQVPDGADEALCVLRIRYNISTNDYPAMAGMTAAELDASAMFYDSRFNCPSVDEQAQATDPDVSGDSPNNDPDSPQAAGTTAVPNNCEFAEGINKRQLYNRPYVRTFSGGEPPLSVALNTDQAGRTFEVRAPARWGRDIPCLPARHHGRPSAADRLTCSTWPPAPTDFSRPPLSLHRCVTAASAGPVLRLPPGSAAGRRSCGRHHLEPEHARAARQYCAVLPLRGVRLRPE